MMTRGVAAGASCKVVHTDALAPQRGRLQLRLRGKARPASANVESAFKRLARAGNYAGGRIVTPG
jgi:hypothetical protein